MSTPERRHYLTIYTYPISENIYVNGELWGRGYVRRLVPEDIYTISFGYREGYISPPDQRVYVDRATTVRGRYERVAKVEIPKKRHYLEVYTSPISGPVYIDNIYVGVAPVIRLVAEGWHTVSFGFVEGYITPSPIRVNVVERTRVYGLYSPIPKAPEIVYFRAVPPEIRRGESSTLEWETRNAVRVTIDGTEVSTSGKLVVTPERTTTYTLTATSPYGLRATATVTVTVRVVGRWKRVVFVLGTYDIMVRNLEAHFRATWNLDWGDVRGGVYSSEAEGEIKAAIEDAKKLMHAFLGHELVLYDDIPAWDWDTNFGVDDDGEFRGEVFSEEDVPKFYEFFILDKDYLDQHRAECKFKTDFADWRENMEEMKRLIRENTRKLPSQTPTKRGKRPKLI
jgi:hypothetical protein